MRHDEPKNEAPSRRASVPAVKFGSFTNSLISKIPPVNDAVYKEHENCDGRLEIRIVNSIGNNGAIIQTIVEKEPIKKILTNGTTNSPASPNPGPDEPSIYYDATESRANTNNTSLNKAIISQSSATTNNSSFRDYRDNKERDSSRPHSVCSKIPVPVKSPRCSLSESTPDPNTQNTKTGSEHEKSIISSTQSKDNKEPGWLILFNIIIIIFKLIFKLIK